MDDSSQMTVPPLLQLDEQGVAALFAQLGFPWYDAQIKEHGITGEILVHLDHEALRDVGIHSVGQRLAVLKAVYALKVAQNVPVEEGHYIPPSDDLDHMMVDSPSGYIPQQRILGLLHERDDRIRNLETEVQRLHDSFIAIRDETLPRVNGSSKNRPTRSPTAALFPHPLSNTSTLSRNNSTSTRPQRQDTNGSLPDSPRSPGVDSPRMPTDLDADADSTAPGSRAAGYSLHPSAGGDFSTSGALTPTTPTGPMSNEPHANSGSITLSSSTSNPALGASTGSLSNSTGGRSERLERSATQSSADNPYRSFRVTLEDPCYKVLPAALKKYKINDDWRQYALFICYGNTERCLAYDEKPLMLFQRLKENNANPVFMLRHIKDIKSPITVASAKHAMRRDRRPANAGAGLDRPPATDRQGAPMARPTRLHHPPVLLPLGKDKEGEAGAEKGEGEDSEKPPASPREAPGYCISIYPYLAEREDEFDVNVGDTFVIISKTKGWWVVHRDLGPNSTQDLTTRKSAWVPAGCLLETSVPPLSLPGAASPGAGSSPYNASNVAIEPTFIVSVSTPGLALMDYNRNGSDELDVKKGNVLRILKRYNHWSYAIKEDGQRGWIPSWFCGRAYKEGTPTTPTTSSSSGARNGSVPSIRPGTDEEPRSTSPSDGRGLLGAAMLTPDLS
ncbi:hypothetical protein RQP46_001089 [Phenoliferia psychrophenolica]